MLNLQLVQTGEIRPTCSAEGGAHNPVNFRIDDQAQLRMMVIPGVPLEKSVAFSRSDAGRWMGYKTPAHVSAHCNLTEEDQGVLKVRTPGGVQEIHVVYWSGLTKLIMHSQAQQAYKAQAWLASKSSDLAFYGIAFRDKSAAQGLADLSQNQAVLSIRQDLSGLAREFAAFRQEANQHNRILAQILSQQHQMLSGQTKSGKAMQNSPPLTASNQADMRKRNFWMLSAHLIDSTGQSNFAHGLTPGLTRRCLHFAKQHCQGQDVYRRFVHQGKVVTFIWRPIIELVIRTNWHSGDPNPLKGGDLFGTEGLSA